MEKNRHWGFALVHALSLGLILFASWLLMSGIFEPLILILGVFSCALVVVIAVRMDVIDHEAVPVHLTFKVLLYWPWLLWEIVKANIDVTKRVLGFADISPTMVRIKATQKTDLGIVIFANSITLTPGTISIDVDEEGYILVHALSRDGTEGLEGGDMDRRVTELEGRD
ncbi:MAG: Na+/H+ antiporter subunit E [Alphaproteobacteria bacterium]|nr:Na+/H+ antiporter subunit E [Alphaproteobacteria bacterium]